MKLEDIIDEALQRVCDEFAKSLEKYDLISGGGVPPEQFISSYILVGMADVLTMTAETNTRDLWEWNQDFKQRDTSEPKAELSQEYRSSFGQRRVDLVIYKGEHTKKNEMRALCLLEIKPNWTSYDDVKKISGLLSFLDGCQFGAICYAIDISHSNFELEKSANRAKIENRHLVMGRVARPLSSGKNWQTCAEFWENPAFRSQ